MNVHVKGEVVDLVERLVAYITFVCLFAAVRESMILVVALLVESLAAVLTNVWLVICVNACVGV